MELNELAGQINEQHRETQARLISLDDKITDVNNNVIKIENTMQTKDVCELHRDCVHDAIRKAGMWNKIATSIALFAAAMVGWLGFRGK